MTWVVGMDGDDICCRARREHLLDELRRRHGRVAGPGKARCNDHCVGVSCLERGSCASEELRVLSGASGIRVVPPVVLKIRLVPDLPVTHPQRTGGTYAELGPPFRPELAGGAVALRCGLRKVVERLALSIAVARLTAHREPASVPRSPRRRSEQDGNDSHAVARCAVEHLAS